MSQKWLDPATQFDELYQMAYPGVYKYIFRLAPSEAEDLTQDTFLSAYKARHTYVPKAAPTSWLITIAHHRTVSWLRSKKSHEWELKESFVAPPPKGFAAVETRQLLELAAVGLSSRAAEVVQLYYLDELGLKEIAARLNIPRMTVSSRKMRGLNQMREVLTDGH